MNNTDRQNNKTAAAASIAAGTSTAAAVGGGISWASGMRRFGDAAISKANAEAKTIIDVSAEEALHPIKKMNSETAVTKEFFIDTFKAMGRSHETATKMAMRELAKQRECHAAEEKLFVEREIKAVTKEMEAKLGLLEREAAGWKAASIFEKPLLGFRSASMTVKLGAISAAAAIGLGVGWAVHRSLTHAPAKSFAERVHAEGDSPMLPSR